MAQIQELAGQDIRVLPLLLEECEVPLSLRDVFWADFATDYSVGLNQVSRRLSGGQSTAA